MRVNLVGEAAGHGGISRYRAELIRHLGGRVQFVPCRVSAAGLAAVPLLRQLPLSVSGLAPGAPVHFTQIVGTGAAWFRRLPDSIATVLDLGFLVWPPERRMFSPAACFFLWLSFTALRRMDRIIAISHATRDSLIRHLGIAPERMTVIHLGVDHETFRPQPTARARRRLQEGVGVGDWAGGKTLLAVGSELPRKNVNLLLEVLAAAQRRGERLRLVKVGRPGVARFRAHTVRRARELGVLDRIRFIEDVDDATLALLYAAADVYVNTSHVEGFSLPAAEALACGAVVAVSDAGALPEIVGDAGLVVRARTVDAWVDQLLGVLADPGRAGALSAAGPVRAARFRWDAAADRTLHVYRSLGAAAADAPQPETKVPAAHP